jgi:hypothetical protein
MQCFESDTESDISDFEDCASSSTLRVRTPSTTKEPPPRTPSTTEALPPSSIGAWFLRPLARAIVEYSNRVDSKAQVPSKPRKKTRSLARARYTQRKKASVFDNFYSPANQNFYTEFDYGNLRTDQHEFRLLKIISCETGPKIRCEFLKRDLTKVMLSRQRGKRRYFPLPPPLPDMPWELPAGPYTIAMSRMHGNYYALSYCARDPQKTIPILVNDREFNAFATLAHGIANVHHFWNIERPGEELLLWVDQICINQSKSSERSHQVGLMREVYQHAQKVIISFSDGHGVSPSLDWLSRLIQELRSIGHVFPLDNAMDESALNACRPNCLLDLFKHRFRQGLELTSWSLAYDFLAHPWWTRAWVFQEFLVSSRVYFCTMTQSMSWLSLSPALSTICSLSAETFENFCNPYYFQF